MEKYYQTDTTSREFEEELSKILEHLKQYIEVVPNNKEEYKYLFYGVNKLIGTIKYNNYPPVIINYEPWYPSSATIEVNDSTRVFKKKWQYSYSIEEATDLEKYYQRELKAGNKNIAWEHIK